MPNAIVANDMRQTLRKNARRQINRFKRFRILEKAERQIGVIFNVMQILDSPGKNLKVISFMRNIMRYFLFRRNDIPYGNGVRHMYVSDI